MKIELLVIAITAFFIFNTYSDGKYLKLLKSWKKYYQMAGIGFVGLSAYLFLKKHPDQSRSLLTHANGIIKYMPIDKESSDMLAPLLDMSRQTFGGGGGDRSQQERRIINSGQGPANVNTDGGVKTVKRSVSETKKKYVAAQQGWNCGACKKQLPAWFEVDHKIRLDNGGSNQVDNLVALCRDCHGKKTAFENL
jgi:hypothetical protein